MQYLSLISLLGLFELRYTTSFILFDISSLSITRYSPACSYSPFLWEYPFPPLLFIVRYILHLGNFSFKHFAVSCTFPLIPLLIRSLRTSVTHGICVFMFSWKLRNLLATLYSFILLRCSKEAILLSSLRSKSFQTVHLTIGLVSGGLYLICRHFWVSRCSLKTMR